MMTDAAPAPTAPIPAPPVQPHTELLNALGLTIEDLRRLQHDDVTVMELMTEHLRPIAQRKELARQADMESAWEYHRKQTREAEKNGTAAPTWYYSEPHDHKFTENEALEQLACEIAEGICAHNDISTSKAYDLSIKDELPEWMTWTLLDEWSSLIKLEARLAREPVKVADYQSLYPEI
jgi:hypothetical protein